MTSDLLALIILGVFLILLLPVVYHLIIFIFRIIAAWWWFIIPMSVAGFISIFFYSLFFGG